MVEHDDTRSTTADGIKSNEHLTKFLASPHFTGAEGLMPNLYE
ncbi:hypothetical protein [Microbacterium phyllosphaerae]|nr:hypothetical protein [Microbacterium phyllosphaerae]